MKIKETFIAWIQWGLWYEVRFYSDRVAFGGGVLAGTIIQLAAGLDPRVGYGFQQSAACALFGLLAFIILTAISKAACRIGEKYGNPVPMMKIVEEIRKG